MSTHIPLAAYSRVIRLLNLLHGIIQWPRFLLKNSSQDVIFSQIGVTTVNEAFSKPFPISAYSKRTDVTTSSERY